ncbi:MAG: 4Fe-4S binding protein [Desulfatibacillaceae bacterium]|nr:4Fe-4S binding protein [Desulfatibacillaceae bacterium]
MSEKSLYEQLADKIMVPGSKLIPELFAMLVNEDEARILLALPGFAQDLAEKSGMTQKDMEAKLKEFFDKGLVFKSIKPEGVKYRLCRDIVQFHDATILWSGAGRDYFDKWQQFMETEWPAYAKMVESVVPRPFTRIIPVDRSITPRTQILAFESAREVIEQNDTIAVTPCTCRLIARKCDSPVEVCLQVGKAADYNIERGTGRKINKEEALEILVKSEEAGLMHVTMNRSHDMHFICNCCGCCCIAMPIMIEYGTKMVDPSRFLAVVDADACQGCGTCEDRCWFSAIIVDAESAIAVVDADKCMGCGVCQVSCPEDAISLKEVRQKEFVPAA